MTSNPPWLNIIGIGEDGWEGLSEAAQNAVLDADSVIGGARHLAMIPRTKNVEEWPSPIKSYLNAVLARRGENICVLATGDPMFYGVGARLARLVPREEMRIFTHLSAYALICAAMGWSEPDCTLVTACGRPVEQLNAALFDNARIVFYSADETTPAEAVKLLIERGFGESQITLFENTGGPKEARHEFTPLTFPQDREFSRLNALAIECKAAPDAAIYAKTPGLPESAYETDGQITKRDVRAAALARLSPRPGELLWDIGAGSGSIGIEWMRAAHEASAIAIEASEKRAERISTNAARLGVPKLKIVNAKAPAALAGLTPPDAIFIGGGLSQKAMLKTCWQALKPGGRLCANGVTLETETSLFAALQKYGGEMTRIEVSHAGPIGSFMGWKPARPVTIWSVTKPFEST